MKYETFAKRLGNEIARMRQEKGLTQANLSREAGLSLKYVSMIEQGTNPSVRTIFKVCDALDTTLVDIMAGAGVGTVGKKPKRMEDVQVDIPSDDPNVKKLLKLIRGLETEDRRRALKLIKTTFGER